MPKLNELTLHRDKNGDWPSHSWPGCYPIYYLNIREDVLCPFCANKSPDLDSFDFTPTHYDIHFEGASLVCDCCDEEIPSAYGEPQEDDAYDEDFDDEKNQSYRNFLAACETAKAKREDI